jgi:2,3-dihydroxybenzoate decarboxylase
MKRICVEEHWNNSYLDEIAMSWVKRVGFGPSLDPKAVPLAQARAKDFEEFRLPLMDELGIAVQVLSTTGPGIQGIEDTPAAVAAAQKTNDDQAEIIRKYPGRFAGFASLPTQDPVAAADELERAVKELAFKGAMIQGHTNGEYLDDEKFRVIWERAEELGVPICLHITEPPAETRKIYAGYPEIMGASWAWGVEAATHVLRIITRGVFDAFPGARLMLGHLGESLPYVLGRLDEGYRMAVKTRELKKTFSEYIRENILINTSGKYRSEALVCAVSALGADHVLFAVDYPYVNPQEAIEQVEKTTLSDSDKEKIYHVNAERLLKL